MKTYCVIQTTNKFANGRHSGRGNGLNEFWYDGDAGNLQSNGNTITVEVPDHVDNPFDFVFEKTNTVTCGWWEHDCTQAESLHHKLGGRSTSVGDIIVDPDYNRWVVTGAGFEKL